MTTEAVEGEVRELPPERAMVVAQPGQALVALPADGPDAMIERASRLASALRDVVDRQELYAVISGKKFPQVEAWMTIGRMDNVVAREAEPPIRHDDGSYEGFAELIRLSDGMVIGRASALCGTPDDKPWATRPEPARRSMAVTRATSRAFRQQYSWIMALAGYEATPAEEMPHDAPQRPAAPASEQTPGGGLSGKGWLKDSQSWELRQEPTGPVLGFRVGQSVDRSTYCVAHGAVATALLPHRDDVLGKRVTVWGVYTSEHFFDRKQDPPKRIDYRALQVERIKGDGFDLAAPDEPTEAPSEPLFSEEEQARIAAAVDAA